MSSPPPSPAPTASSASNLLADITGVPPAPETSSEQALPQSAAAVAAAKPPPTSAATDPAVSGDAGVGGQHEQAAGTIEAGSAQDVQSSAAPSAAESMPKQAETRDAPVASSVDSSALASVAGVSESATPTATGSTPASTSTATAPPTILSPTPTPISSSSLTGAVASASAGAPSSSLAAPASATPSRDASPSSAASSARLAAGAKKFSALNVNKKFLETAIATAGKENKDADKTAAAKGAAAAAPVPSPAPHPPSRLLTTRPAPPPSAAPRPSAAPPSQWGATRPSQGPGAAGAGARRPSGGAPWSSGGPREGADGPSWRSLQANFPTTKESLEDRERAAQKAAANAAEASKAEAEHQKAIIQELDSFRGSHLDPNAHHWDEPESDDDDFLNEVVDFGDGKKYTISASPQEPSFAADILDQREKLTAAENAKHGSGGRGDFDRNRSVSSASKPQLFNERSNRLEPKDSAGGLPKGRRLSNDPAPARGTPAPMPASQPAKPAWGIIRDANGKIVPSLPPSRALPPHLAAAAAMAAAGIKPTATPAASAPVAAISTPAASAARSSAIPSRSGGLGSVRPTGGLGEKRISLSAPRGALVEPRGGLAKPTTSPRPSAAQPVAPPAGPAADRRASHDGPRPAAPTAGATATTTLAAAAVAPPPVIEDITELQKDEMHTAAERARLRRQKEEEERAAAQERARQKAKELEAKFGPAPSKSAALQAKAAPKDITRKPAKATSTPAAGASAPPSGPRAGAKGVSAQPLPKIPVPIVPAPTPSAPPPQEQQPTSPALAPAPAPAPVVASAQPTLAAAPPTLAQLIEGQHAGAESRDVDFANLGDLLAAENSPTQTMAQPLAASTGPVLPPPAPSRADSAWRRQSTGEKQPATESTPAALSSSQSLRPTVSVSSAGQKGKPASSPIAAEDIVQRIKGAVQPATSEPAAGQAPVQVAEPESPFTYQSRPPSPSPVWKKYSVKLNKDARQRTPIPAKQIKVDPKRETLRAFDALSWTPSMYKWLSFSTLSRDDWLLAPPFRKVLGRVAPKPAPTVSLPTQRISDLPVMPPPESPVFQRAVVKLPAAPALEVIPPTPARGGADSASQFSRSSQEATWRRAPAVGASDPSAAVGGPIKPLVDAGSTSNVLFTAPSGPETTGAPIIRLRSPPGSKSSLPPKLPQGSSIGFYRDRTPSIGTASDEQMASLVRFTVSSELMDGPGASDPVYEEDGPSFPSLNRPSSTAGSMGVMSAQDEAFELSARAATAAASALSPPSAATSDAWSKTPMAYSPSDRPALPGLYGGQPGVPSHSPWAAAPSYDVNAQYSPKLSHQSPQYQQQQQQQQHTQLGNNGLRGPGQYNPYAQQQRYASPAHGYALPTSSPHPSAAGGPIYSSSSTMNGNAPRFQPQQQQHSSTRPDPSARPFVPGGSGNNGHHHPGLNRNGSSDMGGPGSAYGAPPPGSSPIGGNSPYSPGISLPGLPPAVQGGVWVPISMPLGGRGAEGGYGSSPSLASTPLPTPYYTPQPYQQQQQQQRMAPGQQQQQQPRFRNLSEFSTSSPSFTPQRGAFGGNGGAGGSPFEVRPQATAQAAAAAAAGQDDGRKEPAPGSSAYFPSVRAPVFTPSGGAGTFGKGGPW